MKKQFFGTLFAGIILIIGALLLAPTIKREMAISDYAERYGLSKSMARILTHNGKDFDKPKFFELIEQAKGQ